MNFSSTRKINQCELNLYRIIALSFLHSKYTSKYFMFCVYRNQFYSSVKSLHLKPLQCSSFNEFIRFINDCLIDATKSNLQLSSFSSQKSIGKNIPIDICSNKALKPSFQLVKILELCVNILHMNFMYSAIPWAKWICRDNGCVWAGN